MDEVIRVKDQFYILASSSLAEEQSRVLKQGETFALFDAHGDIRRRRFEDHGIYHEGTRFLSRYVLRLGKRSPLLLSSTVKEENDLLVADLTNPDFPPELGERIPRGTVHICRSIFLWQGCAYERMVLVNYGLTAITLSFSIEFEADYMDIFEVRGTSRERRGRALAPEIGTGRVVLGYEGLDGVQLQTRIELSPPPAELSVDHARFSARLVPHQEQAFYISIACHAETGSPAVFQEFEEGFRKAKASLAGRREESCSVESSNEQFNSWITRSAADLNMMLTETRYGLYPFAGIPWFSTVFGRDGIITALQMLWINPDIARGVLEYLAAFQATEVIPEQDAEPGKILHEVRKGEMAKLKEIPFGLYYGTIDATPLFVLLAGYYFERTGDRDFVAKIWPAVERALDWINQYGDTDRDGFVEYSRRTERGLAQQGWKDSEDSVFHADGRLAAAPIALSEVQGYVYAAKSKASELAAALGKPEVSEKLEREAGALKAKFNEAFWDEGLGMYALALDGEKRPCLVKSSNAGQCLFTGIATEERAQKIAAKLLGADFFTGWGIRTLGTSEVRYNPMSYHNGTVWPHDNSLIGLGMARYHLKSAALRVLSGLFEASVYLDLHRLPELFCGFERRLGEGPTLYPVACDPQAWACGSVFLLMQACLGLEVKAERQRVMLRNPVLPRFLNEVRLINLRVGNSRLDLTLRRHEHDVGINVTRREGKIDVVTIK